MAVRNAVGDLKEALKQNQSKDRDEAIATFCRRLMIEGEVHVPKDALAVILESLRDDDSLELRHSAADFVAWAAEWTHTEFTDDSLALLCKIAKEEDDDAIVFHVFRAFGYISSDERLHERVEILRNALSNEALSCETRGEAVEALGRLRAEDAKEDLIALLDERDENLLSKIILAIAMVGAKGCEDSLYGRLQNEDNPRVRAAIVNALSLCAAVEYGEAMKEMFEDSNEDELVRVEALKAAPLLSPQSFQSSLIKALIDESERIRGVACLLMIEQRMELQEQEFERLMKDEAQALEGRAEQALLLWALHKWRCALEGKGTMPEYNRRLDDFLVEYAEQSLLNDMASFSKSLSGSKKKGPE